jgi:hypothetical protein
MLKLATGSYAGDLSCPKAEVKAHSETESAGSGIPAHHPTKSCQMTPAVA